MFKKEKSLFYLNQQYKLIKILLQGSITFSKAIRRYSKEQLLRELALSTLILLTIISFSSKLVKATFTKPCIGFTGTSS